MRQIITIFIFIASAFTCFGQTYFMDNLKSSKWKSIDNFNDSTILHIKELKLCKWIPGSDSLKHNPTIWLFDKELKIKYYFTTVKSDSASSKTNTEFNILNCNYSFENNLLTTILDNKYKSKLTFRTAIVSTGSYIILTRKND
jgi:hypothetical protein